MVANRRVLTVLSWALVVLVVISAVVTLLLSLDLLLPQPAEFADFVDQLIAYRTYDREALPFVIVGSLAALGVYLIAAMFGLVLRAWARPTPERDAMSLLLLIGGVVGVVSQLANIAVGQAANPGYCDCGYRAEEVVALDKALVVGWALVNWLAIGAVSLVGAGLAVAGRVVAVSPMWRTLSYGIVAALLFAVALRIVGSLVFIAAFDPFQVSDLIVAVTTGIFVPIWAVLLARGVSEPGAPATAAAA